MTFDRPNKPQKPSSNRQSDTASRPQKKVIPDPVKGGGNRGGGNNHEPSPWLNHPAHTLAKPSPEASFVEYLRWMRSLDQGQKDATKTQILQLAEESANYTKRLKLSTERTKKIAGEGNYFQVQCPWRIRVGGHRGPESILLPAFDALGMPFIPSSTLRGVARAEALRQLGSKEKVSEYFGDLDAKDGDRMGKVVFLDAYPLPSGTDKSGGLTVDMANNIWKWQGDSLEYAPNPNPSTEVREIENKIFGGINPRYRGYVSVHVYEDRKAYKLNAQKKGEPHGLQKGKLILIRSQETLEAKISDANDYETAIQTLSKSIVWFMFHLGGVGLGARRPLYSRDRKNGRRPWWRGSNLTMLKNQTFGDSPRNCNEFKNIFQQKLRDFYNALSIISSNSLPSDLLATGSVTSDNWYEAGDRNCLIFVVPNPVSKEANISKAL